MKLAFPVVEIIITHWRLPLWQLPSLLNAIYSSFPSIPFSAATNFTTLADYCEHFAETIIECHDLALKMAPCGRLSTCLTLLRPTLGEPIPPHLIDRFTVDVLPDVLPEFTPDADLLCDYCLALAQVLLGRSLLPETETTLTGLLCDLVWYFADGLKAPRWIRTTDGVQPCQ